MQHKDTGESDDEGTVEYSVSLNDVIEVGRHLYVSVWAINGVSVIFQLLLQKESSTWIDKTMYIFLKSVCSDHCFIFVYMIRKLIFFLSLLQKYQNFP